MPWYLRLFDETDSSHDGRGWSYDRRAALDLWNATLHLHLREFWHLERALDDFAHHASWPSLDDWTAAATGVTNATGLPVRFGPHAPRKRGEAWALDNMYDAHIYRRGEVPSRTCNWHDFFNMAIWRTFPRAKAEINRAQYEALLRWLPGTEGAKLPNARLPEQDTLALLDEGGVLVALSMPARGNDERPPSEEEANTAIAEGRALVVLFGHALLEHLVTGQGEVRGASVVLSSPSWPTQKPALLSALDEALANSVRRGVSVRRGERGLSLTLARTHAFVDRSVEGSVTISC